MPFAATQDCGGTVQFDLNNMTIASIVHAIDVCKHSCVDVTQFFLNRIQQHDHKINSMISLDPEALNEAARRDRFYRETRNLIGPLHCVPFVVNDNIWTIGWHRTRDTVNDI